MHHSHVPHEVRSLQNPYSSLILIEFSYLDRINVSNARLAGLQKDLRMTDTIWNTGISTFYVGYLLGQLPGNLWLAKADPRWLLPSMMMAWSIGTICMPAMTSGAGFAVCRFFIGFAEAPFSPGITLSKSGSVRSLGALELMSDSDVVLVHQRRKPHAHGHLARGKHYF
jgi:MFS family permease